MAYSAVNPAGVFVVEKQSGDEKNSRDSQEYRIIEEYLFREEEAVEYSARSSENKSSKQVEDFLERVQKKHGGVETASGEVLHGINRFLFEKKKERFRKNNTAVTKVDVKRSVTDSSLIKKTIRSINELEEASASAMNKLREWYSIYIPEFERECVEDQKFVEIVVSKSREEILSDLGVEQSMGAEVEERDREAVDSYAEFVKNCHSEKEELEEYLEEKMEEFCPNLLAVAGKKIGAELLNEAGSLKKLSRITSGTLQLLGAEKALFRHLKNKKHSPPKHGLIFNHPLVQGADAELKGKTARKLADKLSIAVKIDYFKGDFKGEELKEELQEELGVKEKN